MSMVGQSESDDIFVSELKAKELMITGSYILLSLFKCENKTVDLITMGSLSFGIQKNIFFRDLLCPTPPCKGQGPLQYNTKGILFIRARTICLHKAWFAHPLCLISISI